MGAHRGAAAARHGAARAVARRRGGGADGAGAVAAPLLGVLESGGWSARLPQQARPEEVAPEGGSCSGGTVRFDAAEGARYLYPVLTPRPLHRLVADLRSASHVSDMLSSLRAPPAPAARLLSASSCQLALRLGNGKELTVACRADLAAQGDGLEPAMQFRVRLDGGALPADLAPLAAALPARLPKLLEAAAKLG